MPRTYLNEIMHAGSGTTVRTMKQAGTSADRQTGAGNIKFRVLFLMNRFMEEDGIGSISNAVKSSVASGFSHAVESSIISSI